MKVTILRENEIRECVGMNKEAVDAVALGFTRLVEEKVSLPPIIRVDVEANQGEVDIKTAYIEGLDHFAIKIASGFFNNPSIGLPYGSGMMVLMSAKTGFLEAVLLDNGYLTDLRTGIAGAIAAKYLAPAQITTAGVIGSGVQARYQIRGLRLVRDFQRLMVYGINPDDVERYASEMKQELGSEHSGLYLRNGGVECYQGSWALTFLILLYNATREYNLSGPVYSLELRLTAHAQAVHGELQIDLSLQPDLRAVPVPHHG